MRFRQIGQHFGKELEPDQKAMQRVFVEVVAATENGFEQLSILLEVTQQQTLGELALVLEVIEEAALGDTRCNDQLVDRGCGEPLGEHSALSEFEQTFAGIACSPGGLLEHRALYHEYSLRPGARAETSRFKLYPVKKPREKILRAIDHESAYETAARTIGVRLLPARNKGIDYVQVSPPITTARRPSLPDRWRPRNHVDFS